MSRAVTASILGAFLLVIASCSPKATEPRPSTTDVDAESSVAGPTTTVAHSSLEWRSCAAYFECAEVTVPLDYSGVVKGDIRIALRKWPAASQSRSIGALLVDPGGPGGSGLDFIAGRVRGWKSLHERFDIVAFDPRGVGRSGALDCVDSLDDYFAVAAPRTPDEQTLLIEAARSFADGCAVRGNGLVGYLGAEHVARDMDRIRIALGESKLTYLGFSYGTYLGAMYAELFPERVRALVLDGAVDPTLSAMEWQLEQAQGFEVALSSFFAACGANPACPFHSGGHPQQAYEQLMAIVTTRPLATVYPQRVLTASLAELAVVSSLYSPSSGWQRLATALASATAGNGSDLLAMADDFSGRSEDGTYDDSWEIYKAITCEDLSFPREVSSFEGWAKAFEVVAPHFGLSLAWEHVNCAFSPIVNPPPKTIDGMGAPPILVVGTLRDPATPYRWAKALAGQLSSGVLLTWGGDGHTAYGRSNCITAIVDDYLINLKVVPARRCN